MSSLSGRANAGKEHSVFATAEDIIEAFRNGEMIILTDDEDRENEGDFIISADHATPEAINRMIIHGRGLVCVSITPERAAELDLPPMVRSNTALMGTAFTVSVDAVGKTTTGISAFDRAATIATMIDRDAKPADLARPGHIFPLVAEPGGILVRPGHTEAVVDLAKAAGATPAGVLCEILDDDGTMARLPRLIRLAEQLEIKIGSVNDLVEYRRRSEQLVREVTDVRMPSVYGSFTLHLFENIYDSREHHLALVKGEPTRDEPFLVRVHSECLTGDVFGSRRCDCGDQLHSALAEIEAEGRGAVLYMRQEGRGIGLANKIRAYKLQENGKDTVEANEALGFKADLRDYWFAGQMLRSMGVERVRLMTNNPRKISSLEKLGVAVTERLPLRVGVNPANEHYLRTKKGKLGHLLHI